jgi:hypothetical protein
MVATTKLIGITATGMEGFGMVGTGIQVIGIPAQWSSSRRIDLSAGKSMRCGSNATELVPDGLLLLYSSRGMKLHERTTRTFSKNFTPRRLRVRGGLPIPKALVETTAVRPAAAPLEKRPWKETSHRVRYDRRS